MNENFEKKLSKICNKELTFIYVLKGLLMRAIPITLILTVLSDLLYRDPTSTKYEIISLISFKILFGILIGILYEISKYNFYTNLIKGIYTKEVIRKKFVIIEGILGFGATMSVVSITYPLSFFLVLTKILCYIFFCGYLFGYSLYDQQKDSLNKYAK